LDRSYFAPKLRRLVTRTPFLEMRDTAPDDREGHAAGRHTDMHCMSLTSDAGIGRRAGTKDRTM